MTAFGQYLDREGYAQRTIEQYVGRIAKIESWLQARNKPALRRCKWPDVSAYLESVPNTHATRSLCRNAINCYCRYLGRMPMAKIRVPRRKRMESKALEPEQMEKILIAAEAMGPEVHAAVGLMYYCGLRRHEVCKARWSDFGDKWMKVLGKGNIEATLPISPKLKVILDRLPRDSRWVLPSDRRNVAAIKSGTDLHIADGTLNLWFTALALATGIKVSPHVVRHTAITEVNDRSGRLSDAQVFARHADPRVTSGYTRVRSQRIIDAVDLL